jgi:hypothetical protein
VRPLRWLAAADAVIGVVGVVALVVHLVAAPGPERSSASGSSSSPSGVAAAPGSGGAAGGAGGAKPGAPGTKAGAGKAGATDARPAAVGLLALRPADIKATDLGRYRVIVMNAWEWGRIGKIKQAHPDTTVLVYKDMASTRSYAVDAKRNDDTFLPTGVGYSDAAHHHPDWFLRDNYGHRVEWNGYPDHWWMDVGSRAYQDAWLAAVSREVAANGWDGVLVDNAIVDPRVYLPVDRRLAAYPSAGAYQAATDRFLERVAPPLRAAGKSVVVNLGGAVPSLDLYRRWATTAGGVMREHFGRGGTDGKGAVVAGDDWLREVEQQEAAAAAHVRYLAVSYASPSDHAFLRYARASYLVAWDGDGQGGALVVTSPNSRTDPWAATWTADVGAPVEGRRQVGGAWVRRFERGIVAVNPGSGAVDVDLGGSYVDDRSDPARTVARLTLAPRSGVVLRAP